MVGRVSNDMLIDPTLLDHPAELIQSILNGGSRVVSQLRHDMHVVQEKAVQTVGVTQVTVSVWPS